MFEFHSSHTFQTMGPLEGLPSRKLQGPKICRDVLKLARGIQSLKKNTSDHGCEIEIGYFFVPLYFSQHFPKFSSICNSMCRLTYSSICGERWSLLGSKTHIPIFHFLQKPWRESKTLYGKPPRRWAVID